MPHTKEEILNNHHTHLLNAEYFAENRVVFNSLSEEEQIKLASEMIANCPPEGLRHLGRAFQALRAPEGSFYNFMASAHKVKSMILSCLDERNPRPYDFLVDEFDPIALKQFNTLALDTLAGLEIRIAARLVLMTPKGRCDKLVDNADIAFPYSTLVKELNKGFILQLIENDAVSAANSPDSLFRQQAPTIEAAEEAEKATESFHI